MGFRGERIVFSGPNTNTNTIRFQKCGRIRIRILLGFRNMAEYEYEYYSGSELWPNTNTNTIRVQKFGRIRILFGIRNMAENKYEYYSGSEILPNTNMNTILSATFVRIRIRIPKFFEWYRIRIRIYTNMNTKTIKKQQIPKLRMAKISFWVFCAFK